jgi:hypothetical protein
MKWLVKFCIVSSALALAPWVQGAGLSTTFVNVVMPLAEGGKLQEVQGPEGKGMVIRNLGNDPIRVSIQPLVPSAQQLKRDAQAIPDLSWVRLDPPHAENGVKVMVQIPRNEKYYNHVYQVMIWSHGQALNSKGISLNAGLLSCLRIQTIP